MSQKIENILNLALEATPEERARSAELDVGYDAGEREWDLIIKYSGSLDTAREIGESVTELLNNYAERWHRFRKWSLSRSRRACISRRMWGGRYPVSMRCRSLRMV